MTDLSKLDFSKCHLPDWNGLQLRAAWVHGCNLHIRDGEDYLKEVYGAIACYHFDKKEWRVTHQVPESDFEQLDELKAICAQVDAFIAAELKRVERANVKLSNGYELLQNHVDDYRAAILQSGSMYAWIVTDEWHIASVTRSRNYEVLAAITEADALMKPELPWRECPKAEAKVEAKIPMVKPPEGTEWVLWGGKKELAISGKDLWHYAPEDKQHRDAMLACVAAFDEQQGQAPLVWVKEFQRVLSVNDDKSDFRLKLQREQVRLYSDDEASAFIAAFERGAKFVLVEVES
jgi:hypothetical protein